MTTETKILVKRIELGVAGLFGLQFITDKLNRRAARHGMNALVVTVVKEWTVRNDKTGLDDPRYLVEIEGCAPCIDGYTFVARIENNDIIGTVVRVVPGEFDDRDYSEYRNHDFGCDHCGTKRRRNDVFVLRYENAYNKVVGRNCLADFLRCKDAAGFADYAEMLDKVANYTENDCDSIAYDNEYGGREASAVEPVERYVSVATMMTRRLGWVSRTAAREDFDDTPATADNVNYYLYGRGSGHTRWIEENDLSVNDDDKGLAGKAVAWAQSLSPEQCAKSEYLEVIRKIATVGLVGKGLDGYAASIVRAYQKDCEWAAEKAARANSAVSKGYIGSPRERLKGLIVTVKRVRYTEGDYGTTTIVAMETTLPDGTVAPMTWFASGSKEFTEGADYTFTGTVKAHKPDNGYGLQTQVNRCKLTLVE